MAGRPWWQEGGWQRQEMKRFRPGVERGEEHRTYRDGCLARSTQIRRGGKDKGMKSRLQNHLGAW